MIQCYDGDGVDHEEMHILGVFAQILTTQSHDGVFEYAPMKRDNKDLDLLRAYIDKRVELRVHLGTGHTRPRVFRGSLLRAEVGFPKDRILVMVR